MSDSLAGQKVKDTFGQLVRIKDGAFEDGFGNVLKINVNFHYNQPTPTLVWNVAHNLNRIPTVSILDTAGNVLFADVQHIDLNNLIVTFTDATSGDLWCS